MTHTVLHAISGGIDSTNVLYQLLTQGHQPLLYHIRLHDRRHRRHEAESEATKQIIAWYEERFGVELECVQSTAAGFEGVYDIETAALIAGGLLRRHEAIDTTTTSSSLTDARLSNWQHRHDNRVAITEALANRKLKWLMPNRWKTRQQVIEELPDDLLTLCSFCRNPIDSKPCGQCGTCVMTVQHLGGSNACRK